ncbi:hypothetical protein L7F22_035515 [Adiantum nelumboides]|nr:hypothetical protein [Adiantum nelumboides]
MVGSRLTLRQQDEAPPTSQRLATTTPAYPAVSRVKMLIIISVILVSYGIIIVLTLTVLPVDRRSLFVGTIAAVLNTAMYAAPLAAMVTLMKSHLVQCRMKINHFNLVNVIETKSVESMPFLLSLCTLINSCLWAIYGILKKDPFIIVPNALGVVFGIMQLTLYAWYHDY